MMTGEGNDNNGDSNNDMRNSYRKKIASSDADQWGSGKQYAIWNMLLLLLHEEEKTLTVCPPSVSR